MGRAGGGGAGVSKDPMKALREVDFTKYALSTTIFG